MEFIQAQLARIRQQLSGLTASQRMLAGSLVVIMVMTLFWWANYAAKSELEPLMDLTLGGEETSAIMTQLSGKGISAKVVGDRIMVPVDRKFEAISLLGYLQLLPRESKNLFDDLIAKSSPFDTPRKTDAMYMQVKQQVLAQAIQQWPRVARAAVIIDDKRQRGPGGVEPSATVNITMKSGEAPSEQLVNAAADWVAGSVADLKREKIKVIIDGVSHRVRGQEDQDGWGGNDEWLKCKQASERYFGAKVQKQFSFVENLMVQVNVTPNLKHMKEEKHTLPNPKEFLLKPVTEQQHSEESKSTTRPPENGVSANAPLAAGEVAAGDSSGTTTDENKTQNFLDYGHADISTFDPGGDAKVTSASVLLPHGYFLAAWKKKTNSAEDPKEDALAAFIGEELKRMKPWVANCLGMVAEDPTVTLDWYPDVMPTTGPAPSMASSAVPLVITDHLKEIAIGALALVSLFMVSNMVRKNAPAPALEALEPVRQPHPLPRPDEMIGEAMEGSPALDGVELDEDSARAQQILNQVSDLVGDNPDGAAALVKRWLNRT
jgi:flagellar biosynthesis/type III secretory pathway M-ring protein FliF/YscJ